MTELVKGLSLVERYTLDSPVGSGGMAEVWLARDERNEKQVALKFLKPGLTSKPEFIDLLKTEAERCRRLYHPAIVRVYGFYSEHDLHFIAMEYLPGGSLLNKRMDWQKALSLFLPVIDALEYAHGAGFVHRDLRAANILLDEAGRPRIVDFGVAVALTTEYQAASTGGSLPSMSPQQLDAEPPDSSDDIYGLGALIYEVLTGEPLFHPEVTAERIRSEEPPRLSTLVADIPPELDRLVASMLEKQVFRRPPGMASVRTAVEDILAGSPPAQQSNDNDSKELTPVARKRPARRSAEDGFKPRRLQDKDTVSGSAWRLYAVLGSLIVIALGVVFLLPSAVDNSAAPETTSSAPAVEPETPPPVSSARDQVGRELADAALAELLRLSDQLRARAVELWGGSDWFEAVNRMKAGDEAYKQRDFAAAGAAYREALELMKPLPDRVDEVFAKALQDGQQALNDGNQQLAIERFELALAVDPANLTAAKGLERALQLDSVIELVNTAAAFEVAEQWQEALENYEAALSIDSEWLPAREGSSRVGDVIAADAYQSAMSSGYRALGEEQYDAARRFFNSALAVRPQDQDALQALQQIENDQRLARVSSLNRQAEQRMAEEDWKEAVSLYQAVLAIDTSVTGARNGLAESQSRVELDQRLNDAIASPDRLSDPPVLEATRQLLDYARGIASPGPVLTAQTEELDRLLRRAVIPVSVRFESDNKTEVVIYKVGRFAPFTSQDINLRPGVYTAVGVRSGFRDVRLTFRVQPESAMQPVVIQCEDPI